MKLLALALPLVFILFSCKNEPVDLAEINKSDQNTIVKNDRPYSGQVVKYYKNGKKQVIENVDEGIKHGKYLSYYKTGTKKLSGKFENGKRKGKWTWYDEKGEVNYQINYSKNFSLKF